MSQFRILKFSYSQLLSWSSLRSSLLALFVLLSSFAFLTPAAFGSPQGDPGADDPEYEFRWNRQDEYNIETAHYEMTEFVADRDGGYAVFTVWGEQMQTRGHTFTVFAESQAVETTLGDVEYRIDNRFRGRIRCRIRTDFVINDPKPGQGSILRFRWEANPVDADPNTGEPGLRRFWCLHQYTWRGPGADPDPNDDPGQDPGGDPGPDPGGDPGPDPGPGPLPGGDDPEPDPEPDDKVVIDFPGTDLEPISWDVPRYKYSQGWSEVRSAFIRLDHALSGGWMHFGGRNPLSGNETSLLGRVIGDIEYDVNADDPSSFEEEEMLSVDFSEYGIDEFELPYMPYHVEDQTIRSGLELAMDYGRALMLFSLTWYVGTSSFNLFRDLT